jgi:uncharacterized protein
VFGKQISSRRSQSAITQFRAELVDIYRVLILSEQVVEQAMQLAERHALRAYDAVQLASGLILAHTATTLSPFFVCADERLNSVAQSEGLTVINPNHHP